MTSTVYLFTRAILLEKKGTTKLKRAKNKKKKKKGRRKDNKAGILNAKNSHIWFNYKVLTSIYSTTLWYKRNANSTFCFYFCTAIITTTGIYHDNNNNKNTFKNFEHLMRRL